MDGALGDSSSNRSVTDSLPPSPSKALSAEKRAVHNALERKRRDHIKDMFTQLKEAVPSASSEKTSIKASRAQILKKASEYIQSMRKKNAATSQELEEINQHIVRAKKQIAKLESLRATNNYVAMLPQNVIPSNMQYGGRIHTYDPSLVSQQPSGGREGALPVQAVQVSLSSQMAGLYAPSSTPIQTLPSNAIPLPSLAAFGNFVNVQRLPPPYNGTPAATNNAMRSPEAVVQSADFYEDLKPEPQ